MAMKPTLLAICLTTAAGGAIAGDADLARDRRYSSPEYPAIRDAPPAAGTTIRAPGTRLTNEGSGGPAAGITGRDPRARRPDGR